MLCWILSLVRQLICAIRGNPLPPSSSLTIQAPDGNLKSEEERSKTMRYIVLHHSYTATGKVVSWGNIRKYHMSWRYNDGIITKEQAEKLIANGKQVTEPWIDIGYHMGVEELISPIPSMENPVFVQFGRDLSKPGAHAVGFNTEGYGVCVLGKFDEVEPDPAQWHTALAVVRGLMVKDNIPPENVLGHWETFIRTGKAKNKNAAQAIKSCPGLKFDMDKFRADLGKWK